MDSLYIYIYNNICSAPVSVTETLLICWERRDLISSPYDEVNSFEKRGMDISTRRLLTHECHTCERRDINYQSGRRSEQD